MRACTDCIRKTIAAVPAVPVTKFADELLALGAGSVLWVIPVIEDGVMKSHKTFLDSTEIIVHIRGTIGLILEAAEPAR